MLRRLFPLRASPLSVRLLVVILVASSVLTLIITAVQLFGEYHADVSYIERRVAQVERSYLGPITNSVWNFDETQYVMQLEGILTLQDVVFAQILGQQGEQIAAAGDPGAPADLLTRFPLRVENHGHELDIGTLVVVASFRRVYHDLLHRGLTILVSQGIKTLLISTVILVAFSWLVTRHTRSIADHITRIDVAGDERLVLDRPVRRRADELDVVTAAINQMHQELRWKYREISCLNRRLEHEVAERTRELAEANRKLVEQNTALQDSQLQLLAQQDELHLLASHDSLLPELYNRRGFDQILEREWCDAELSGSTVALAMLDIDHFKRFNDTYGHLAGDEALKRIAAVLVATLPQPRATAARYGGEEFMLLLPGANRDGARLLLERIRHRIQGLAIPHRASQTADVVTLSGGCMVCVPSPRLTHQDCRLLVDDLLYQAKREGRNRIKVRSVSAQREATAAARRGG